jgi:hypothetical protein
MYALELLRKQENGMFKPVWHGVENTASRAREFAAAFGLFPVYRDGNREATYVDAAGRYKLYVTKLGLW